MKKILALLMAFIMVFSLTGCMLFANKADVGIIGGADGPTEVFVTKVTEDTIDKYGWYYSAEDVGLYIYTYGHLPSNFITKDKARELGWDGGSLEDYAEGCAIGGDVFSNREGLLPKADGRIYHECDIDTNGTSSRGAKRIVYSNDGLIYYTEDHYESFTLLYGEE